MVHSDCGWTCGCAGKTVKSLGNTCHAWALLRWWFTTNSLYHVYVPLPLRVSQIRARVACYSPDLIRTGHADWLQSSTETDQI